MYGIDEAGRGALAGPLVVACVGHLPVDAPWVADLRDSKALTARKRRALEVHIRATCDVRTREVAPARIDDLRVGRANREAMRELATEALAAGATDVVVDGQEDPMPDDPRVRPVVRADASVKEAMAAVRA